MPSNTVTASSSCPRPHHGPSIAWPFLASGPITAVFLSLLSGSVAPLAPSFLSSTIERPAARRALARSSAVRKLFGSTALAWSTYGFSNSPARNFTRRIRRTASSIRRSEMRPWSTSILP